MKEWTKEEKKRILDEKDLPELEKLHEQILKSRWRCDYHVQTVTGLMNDPNGFCWYNGKWHLFYQWFPFGPVHGMKHWYHVTSEDLVHWKNMGIAVMPDTWCENNGCYSGSAFIEDNILYYAYTGNSRDAQNQRSQYQLLGKMDERGFHSKYPEPVIFPSKDYTEHQRDPKLFRREEDGKYYILHGAQNKELQGVLLLYSSDTISEGWILCGELKVRGYDHFGSMAECPDLEKIGDKWLLLFSPQGLETDREEFENRCHNIYFIGDMDFENLEFIPDGQYEELDRGFDFYAAQCAFQKQYENTAVLEAWVGGVEYTYPPTDEEGWAGLQTLPRELTIEDGKLMQRPSRNVDALKGELLFEAKNGEILQNKTIGTTPDACVISVQNPDLESFTLNLFAEMNHKGFEISYSKMTGQFTIDRSDMTNQVNTDYGTKRTISLPQGMKSLLVFADHSIVEIFVNDGEYVLTARIFPTEQERQLRMNGKNVDMSIWQANKTVDDDFVITEAEE